MNNYKQSGAELGKELFKYLSSLDAHAQKLYDTLLQGRRVVGAAVVLRVVLVTSGKLIRRGLDNWYKRIT